MAADSKARRIGLVELVGPAGSGKSTVYGMLRAGDPAIEGRPTLRHREYAGIAAASVVGAFATLVRRRAFGWETPLEQVRMMAYLRAMPRILTGPTGPAAIVFDQGPLFFLTRPSLMHERLATWRSRMFDTWAPLLDLVVFLDAPDALLRERINTREKWHALKGSDGRSALEVLRTSRQVYERALGELAARPVAPAIVRLDTSTRSPDEIANAILAELAEDGGSGRKTGVERMRPSSAQ
jgi:hypothetical protein